MGLQLFNSIMVTLDIIERDSIATRLYGRFVVARWSSNQLTMDAGIPAEGDERKMISIWAHVKYLFSHWLPVPCVIVSMQGVTRA